MTLRTRIVLALKLLFAAEVVVIVVASLISPPSLPDVGVDWGDKAGHFIAYAVAAGTGLAAFSNRWGVAAGLFALGVALEIFQGLGSAGRSPEVADALANTAGIAAAVLGERVLRR
ncbi:MAG: hypothetical protein PVI23_07685 [Maricaulaceae bacterium]|jgi:hypothetical protein